MNGLGGGGGRALAETLRLNTTLTSLSLSATSLRGDGGRAVAETLRLNTTLTELDLGYNDLERAEGGRLQRLCASTPPLRGSTLKTMDWE